LLDPHEPTDEVPVVEDPPTESSLDRRKLRRRLVAHVLDLERVEVRGAVGAEGLRVIEEMALGVVREAAAAKRDDADLDIEEGRRAEGDLDRRVGPFDRR